MASRPQKEWQALRQMPVADSGTDTPHNVQGDPDVGSQHATQWVWDTASMTWVRMLQASDPAAAAVHDMRFDFSGSDLIYLGKHLSNGAATSDTGWKISKYTWQSGVPTRIQGPLTGSWDNRASLSW